MKGNILIRYSTDSFPAMPAAPMPPLLTTRREKRKTRVVHAEQIPMVERDKFDPPTTTTKFRQRLARAKRRPDPDTTVAPLHRPVTLDGSTRELPGGLAELYFKYADDIARGRQLQRTMFGKRAVYGA